MLPFDRTLPALIVAFILATCSQAPPTDDACGGCPQPFECVAGLCVCPAADPPCRIDCAAGSDACERGTVDAETCTCRPLSETNRLEVLVVNPSTLTLAPGESHPLEAMGSFTSGEILDVTRSVTWRSDDPSVATVTALSGIVTAVADGTAVLTASAGDLVGESAVTVSAGPQNGEENGTVAVAHDRELRGVWLTTAFSLDFPRTSGMASQQAELRDMLDVFVARGLNTVFFQVRPESDAYYASTLEPWARALTGTQGQDPGWDPLAFIVEEAHARGLELHAWLNPYRALLNRNTTTPAESHVSVRFAEWAYDCGDSLKWMDPGAEVVIDHIVEVVADIVSRYDVDGIHFDDYFYPWPNQCPDFPDGPTYDAYVAGGGTLGLEDWRRDNVNRMIREVGEVIVAERPSVRFGVSPFGIYRNGEPPGITGTSQYDVLFSDPKKWIQEGWVDYLAPQLYWPTGGAQDYATLLPWWAGLTGGGRYVFAGNALYRLGETEAWTVDEFLEQVRIGRDLRPQGSKGNVYYRALHVTGDAQNVVTAIRDAYYGLPALTPPVVASRDEVVAVPEVVVDGGAVTLSHGQPEDLRAWVVYAAAGDGWIVDRIVPAAETTVTLPAGRWALCAATKGNVESLGVVVEID